MRCEDGTRSPTIETTRGVWQLLQNVETTLLYSEMSLSLCRHLFASSGDFWSVIVIYQAEQMPKQYAERLHWARENPGAVEYNPHFVELDTRVRRLVDEEMQIELMQRN